MVSSQFGPPSQPRGLMSLPVEILTQIFRELCLHCQHGNQHDDHHRGGEALVSLGPEMFEVGRQGRAALAKVCRTCRTLAGVAQPLLFHFFHTGNRPSMLELRESDDVGFHPGAAAADLLFPFIRTLLDRPDLATHVRALALYYAKPVRAAAAGEEATNSNLVARIRARIDQHRFGDRKEQAIERPNDFNQYGDDLYIYGITITLASNIEQLLVGGVGFDPFKEYLSAGPLLPHLRYAAIASTPAGIGPGYMKDCHTAILHRLIRRAPSLETLDIANARYLEQFYWMDDMALAPPPLERLRTLRASAIKADTFRRVLACCPVLEDLSYWIDFKTVSVYRYPVVQSLLTEDHLALLYPSLRRLCYSFVDSWFYSHEWALGVAEDEDPQRWSTFSENGLSDLYVSFRGFAQLAILEVEHVMFSGALQVMTSPGVLQGRKEHARDCSNTRMYGLDDQSPQPQRLLEALPASLRILHLGFVIDWIALYHDMEVLARGVIGGQVPLLRIVRAACVVPPPPEEVEDLTAMLQAVGIVFSVGATRKGDNVRGMMPDHPGHPCHPYDHHTAPVFSYGLDCLDGMV